MGNIPHQEENPDGLHARFYIQKIVPTLEMDIIGRRRYKRIDVDPVQGNPLLLNKI
jgi:hypothetical protein